MSKVPAANEKLELLSEKILDFVDGIPNYLEPHESAFISEYIKGFGFFQNQLEAKTNIHEFLGLIPYYLEYLKVPTGAVILDENKMTDKVYFVLKGKLRKFKARQIQEVEEEFYELNGFKFEEKKEKSRPSTSGSVKEKLVIKSIHMSRFKKPVFKLENSSRRNSRRSRRESQAQSPDQPLEEEQAENSDVSIDLENAFFVPRSKFQNGTREDPGDRLKRDREEELRKEKLRIKEEDDAFLKGEAQKKDIFKKRFFISGVPRIERVANITKNTFFGESALQGLKTSDIIISLEECHFLALSRENYKSIIRELVDRASEKTKFFIKLFPEVDEFIVARFSFYFIQKEFRKNEIIFTENDPSQYLYFLKSGQVMLSKIVDPENDKKIKYKSEKHMAKPEKGNIPIAHLSEYQFFGEEILLKKKIRLFSATAGPHGSSCLLISNSLYHEILFNFKDMFTSLKEQAEEKMGWRLGRLKHIADRFESSDNPQIPFMPTSQKLKNSLQHSPKALFNSQSQIDTRINDSKMTSQQYYFEKGGIFGQNRISQRYAKDNLNGDVRKKLKEYQNKFFRPTFTNKIKHDENFRDSHKTDDFNEYTDYTRDIKNDYKTNTKTKRSLPSISIKPLLITDSDMPPETSTSNIRALFSDDDTSRSKNLRNTTFTIQTSLSPRISTEANPISPVKNLTHLTTFESQLTGTKTKISISRNNLLERVINVSNINVEDQQSKIKSPSKKIFKSKPRNGIKNNEVYTSPHIIDNSLKTLICLPKNR